MRTSGSRAAPALATLLLLVGASLASITHAAINPVLNIEGGCDVEVRVGQRVCVVYGFNPTGNTSPSARGLLTVQKGDNAPVQLFNGPLFGAEPGDLCDVVGPGPEVRVLRLTVTTEAGETETISCSYRAVSQGGTGPNLTTRLLVNRQAFVECGSEVRSGNQVCLVFSTDQRGTAEVAIRKGESAEEVIATGSVGTGVFYAVCVIAGAADGETRTFRVTVTSDSGSSTATCAYIVPVSQ